MDFWLHDCIKFINGIMWNYVLIYLLLGAGLFFTLRFGFLQIRLLPHSIRMLWHNNGGGITPFQAFAIGVASRVGTGNIAGVAVALTVGGSGAIFWMWATAFLGMSSSFVEATLAQIFKVKNPDGTYRGGPAYYISAGLKSRFFSIAFALSLILAFGFVFNAVQASSIADALGETFNFPRSSTGMLLVLIAAPILFGGIKRVAKISQFMVPIMAIAYLLLAFWVIIQNKSALIPIILDIINNAFGLKQAAGGLIGAAVSQALMVGIKRGLFSNEAGMGSAPNAAAAATTKHPVTQGLLQMLGVFVDTIIICTATALVILLSGAYVPGAAMEGAALTQRAFANAVGDWGSLFMSAAIFLFAFSSIIGNYAYAESNVGFIFKTKNIITIFRLLVLGMIFFGTIGNLPLIWDMADTSMAFMAIINLVAIVLLSKYVVAAWRDYSKQRQMKVNEPVFARNTIPELAPLIAKGVWDNQAESKVSVHHSDNQKDNIEEPVLRPHSN